MALVGAGSIFIQSTTSASQNIVFPQCIAAFSIDFQTQLAESKCLVDGKRVITSAAITENVGTMKLSFEYADFQTLGFMYDEIASNSANVPIPVIKTATVPTTTPFEINDVDITTANAAQVRAYRASGNKEFLTANATPTTASQFAATNGKITVAAANAGATIQYTVLKTFATLPTIGYESNGASYGDLQFFGTLYQAEGQKYLIHVGKLSRVSTPSIQINGNLATLEVDFRMSVPTGWRREFRLFNIT